ncbi:hypothetical protein CHUAL_005567 [Chamberlinius hualienensis]
MSQFRKAIPSIFLIDLLLFGYIVKTKPYCILRKQTMNRFASNSNSSRVWMDPSSSNNRFQGESSFGNRSADYNVWDSRNNSGQRPQFNQPGFQGNNNMGNGGGGGGGLADGSFLSFLDQRTNQSRPTMQQNNVGQNDLYQNNDRSWNRNDIINSRNVEMARGPLLNEPIRDWRQPDIQNSMSSHVERSHWPSMGTPSGSSNGANQRNLFSNNEIESDEPIKITLPRKDIGSKIIGKSGVLIRDLEIKSRARIEVIDKPGTALAVVELHGTHLSKNTAAELIMKKCAASNPEIEYPNANGGKPRSLFNSPTLHGNNFDKNKQSNNNFRDARGNSDGQGLLKSPECLIPNTNMPFWRNTPKPLMAQHFGPDIARKALLNYPNVHSSNKFNVPKNQFSNSAPKNTFSGRGRKRPFKKQNKPRSANNSKTDLRNSKNTNSATPSKKARRNDLYADSDFALEPKSLEVSGVTKEVECGWMDNLKDITQSLVKVRENFVPPTAGPKPTENWTKNSQLAYDHFAAGSFETGVQLLLKGNGIVNFEPFKQFALAIFQATTAHVGLMSEMPNLEIPLCRKPKPGCNDGNGLPAPIVQIGDLLKKLQVGYAFTTSGKFNEAIDEFRSILIRTPFLLTLDKTEQSKVKKLTIICREYITGLSMEIIRNTLPKITLEDQKRNCELAAYFTRCNLQTSHKLLTLSTALNLFFKLKNFKTAASFAQRLLELEPSPEMVPQLNKIVEVCNTNLVDENELGYDDGKNFAFCSQTYQRIKQGEEEIRCPFCHVRCLIDCKGKICKVCTVAEIGKEIATNPLDEA